MLYTYNGLCYTFPIIEVPVDDIQHKIQQYIFFEVPVNSHPQQAKYIFGS